MDQDAGTRCARAGQLRLAQHSCSTAHLPRCVPRPGVPRASRGTDRSEGLTEPFLCSEQGGAEPQPGATAAAKEHHND